MAVTDCAKCGAKMRIETEEVGKDGNGLPIIHRIGYCDSCMSRFDLDVMQNQPKPKEESKKNSSLSVWAFVLSLFGCTSFIAFILSLVDLCQNDKNKKHGLSWAALVITLLYAFVIFSGTLSNNDEEKQNISQISSVEQSSTVQEKESSEPSTSESGEITYATVGQAVTGEKWKISLLEVKQYNEIYEEFYSDKPEVEGNVFVVLFLEAENISSSDDYFNSLYNETYIDGYNVSEKFLINKPDGISAIGGDVAAGKKTKGYIAFEASPDWQEIEFSYKDWIGTSKKHATFKITPSDLSE